MAADRLVVRNEWPLWVDIGLKPIPVSAIATTHRAVHHHCVRTTPAVQSGIRHRERAMLQLRPNCECCDKDLPPDAVEARICSFECTFCADCVETRLGGVCPNCGGGFASRPIRPQSKLAKFPPSLERVFKPSGCGKAA